MSGASALEGNEADADEQAFRSLHFRRTARQLLGPSACGLLAAALVLNLAFHIWLDGYLRAHAWLPILHLLVAAVDFVSLALVIVTARYVNRMHRNGVLEALRLANRSWGEIWRPLLLLLFTLFTADVLLESAVQIAVRYEPPFIDWWYLPLLMPWALPAALFFSALLLLLNTLRLPLSLQAFVVLAAVAAAGLGYAALGSVMDSLLNRWFWPTAPVRWVIGLFSGQGTTNPFYAPDWLLQFRLTELITGLLLGLCLLALSPLIIAAGRRASEKRLLA